MMTIPLPPEELRAELARLVSSKTFSASRRARQLLEYFFNHLMLEGARELKEYSIGVDVFERGQSFDPQHDTIVRTEVWRLRNKLAAYYATEGAANPLRIGFRTRSFEPIVERRPDIAMQIAQPDRATQSSMAQRIAVLPFSSIDGGNAPFNDGLTTDLIAELGTLPGVHVISRASSFQFKGQRRDVREIAAKLDAQVIVEGSVQQQNRDLHIVLLLTDGSTGAHVYSRTYNRKGLPSLRLQQDLAKTLARDLDIALVQRAAESIGAGGKTSYLDCLMGSRFQFKYRRGAVAELARSIDYFQTVIHNHPDNPAARRALSLSLGTFLSLVPSAMPDVMPRLMANADVADGIDMTSLEAHIAVGMVALFNGEHALAADTLVSLVERNAGNAMAHAARGIFLLHVGQLNEALEEMRIGQRLDPLSAFNAGMLALTLFNLRRIEDAREQAKHTLALDPQNTICHMLLADIEMQGGNHGAALSKLFEICRMSNGHSLALGKLGYAYGIAGKRAEAQRVLNDLASQGDDTQRIAPSIALIYLGLGDMSKALKWLKVTAEQNAMVDMIPGSSPAFDSLRSEPRFTALIPCMR